MRRWLLLALVGLAVLAARDPYAARRERMVREDVAARGIKDPAVLRVMRETPRHLFVPPNLQQMAYADRPLPIGHGQTISQPYIVALMTELLKVKKTHKVLEIGTGSGYQAAVLAGLAEHVYTIEVVPELAEAAKKKLAGYDNVTVRHGDGYRGWPEKAPFDRIILTAAPPELPKALVEQLRPGGRLVAPVGPGPWSQRLILVEKDRAGHVRQQSVLPVVFVPMVHGKAEQ